MPSGMGRGGPGQARAAGRGMGGPGAPSGQFFTFSWINNDEKIDNFEVIILNATNNFVSSFRARVCL